MPSIDPTIKERAIRLLVEGVSQTQVASVVGVQQGTVSTWWREHQGKPKPESRPSHEPMRMCSVRGIETDAYGHVINQPVRPRSYVED